jgi:hypothetical protein
MSKKHLKTDMLMKVAFPHGTIEIYHKYIIKQKWETLSKFSTWETNID